MMVTQTQICHLHQLICELLLKNQQLREQLRNRDSATNGRPDNNGGTVVRHTAGTSVNS
jgi:hypothetical protein